MRVRVFGESICVTSRCRARNMALSCSFLSSHATELFKIKDSMLSCHKSEGKAELSLEMLRFNRSFRLWLRMVQS